MRQPLPKTLVCLVLLACAGAVLAGPTGRDEAVEARFDAAIRPAEMDAWLRAMAAEPIHVGAPHNQENAEMTLAQFREWGWDAKIETFRVLYPTPLNISLDLLGPEPYSVTLTEPPVAGDEATRTSDALPAYLAYQGDGDVTATLIYVNYGMPEDYETLRRMGVSVKGKVVLARYGVGWRGLKPKLAQEHGAVGCIIYSDPGEDGYAVDGVYPDGPARPPAGIQRGSVLDMPIYPGDPLTPGVGATQEAERLSRADAGTILKIPALPISYGEATRLLAALGGQVAPPGFRGSLGLTYRLGDDNLARVRLVVQSDWNLKTIHNVVATLQGAELPDQWVLRGNHRDAWVMGASDPLSGHVAMMAEAKAIGELLRSGWKPKRTLVYLSWDAEEPGLIGSTEWAEAHADELRSKAIVYVNTDGNGRGFLGADGSHSLQHFVNEVAADVTDPQTGVPVGQRLRARLAVAGAAPGASPQQKKDGQRAADPAQDLPIGPLGSGSDYSAFIGHLGIAALSVGFGGEGDSGGVYHSLYDGYAHHSRFVDPEAAYAGALARTAGRLVLRAASADLPPQRYADFAETVAAYLDEVRTLADEKRAAFEIRSKLLRINAFELSADPTRPFGEPTALLPVPHFNLAPLENAVDRLQASAGAYDAALAAHGAALDDPTRARLFDLAREAEQSLAPEVGLPGRPWYRNLVYAPGLLTGYGAKTLPGVREGIEQERWGDVDRYAQLTAAALEAYADALDEGVRLITPP